MSDPSTIATVGLGAKGLGSGLGAFGALREGDAKARSYEYQAGVAQINKKLNLQNRDWALAKGEDEAVNYGLKAGQRAGQITAAQGASGIDVNSGSSVQVRGSQRFLTELDMATIRNNAAQRAYAYDVAAAVNESQTAMYSDAAHDSRAAGEMNAFSSLLSGASSISDKWSAGRTAGLWQSKNYYDANGNEVG